MISRPGQRPLLLSSQRYLDWEESAIEQILQQFKGYAITEYPISVTCTFYRETKRRKDLDNSLASVMDALTASGILIDDDDTHVNEEHAKFGGYDKINPRVEIVLE